MGFFSGLMNYIDEDTIRMTSSEGALECELLLENASDTAFLDYAQAFVRMCNKGQEPPYFLMALYNEAKKRPERVRRQMEDTIKTIHGTGKNKTSVSDLEQHVPKQKQPDYRVMAREMSTQKLQNKLINAKSGIEKDAYSNELKKREEYRKKAVMLSINDLNKKRRDMQKGSEKIVYKEEILRRHKVFSKLQKDYTDVTQRIEKLTDLYECDVILKEDYEEKIKKWGEELEKAKAEEHRKLFVDMEKNIPDVVERIRKIEELYNSNEISQKEYEEKLKKWGEESERIKRREHQSLFADMEKNIPDVVERIQKIEELYNSNEISQKEYEEKLKKWGEELEKTKAEEHQKLFADMEKNIPDAVERVKKIKELYKNKEISQKEYEEKIYDWLS